MQTPTGYREAGVTYYVPPFRREEQIYVECYKMVPVRYKWNYVPTGKEGTHVVYLFKEDVKRFPCLIEYWNRTADWKYTLTNSSAVVL